MSKMQEAVDDERAERELQQESAKLSKRFAPLIKKLKSELSNAETVEYNRLNREIEVLWEEYSEAWGAWYRRFTDLRKSKADKSTAIFRLLILLMLAGALYLQKWLAAGGIAVFLGSLYSVRILDAITTDNLEKKINWQKNRLKSLGLDDQWIARSRKSDHWDEITFNIDITETVEEMHTKIVLEHEKLQFYRELLLVHAVRNQSFFLPPELSNEYWSYQLVLS